MNYLRTPFTFFILAAIACTQLGNGCVSDSGGSDSGSTNPSRPDGSYDSNDRIPSRADLVEEGRGQITWRADRDGRVYLYDADTRRVIGSYDISRGREFIISPKDNRAWIDDKRVLDYNFDRDHTHRVYFLGERTSGGSGGSGSLPRELRDAERVAYGRGDLSFTPRHGGNVWVYDSSDRQIVYKTDLPKEDRIIVSPERNYISIREAKSRASYNLNSRHDYEIYYKRDDRVDSAAGPAKPEPEKPSGPVFGGGGAGATVPKSATIEREGKGSDLSFEAAGIGTVYIYDVDGKTTVATHSLKKGQRFTVSPATGEAAVDGKVVFRKSMSSKKTYRLYFNLNV